MTFSWNFIDLFIILIRIGLKVRFDQINDRLKDMQIKNSSERFCWSQIRTDYYSMMTLVDVVDGKISILILISTGHNLFALCVMVFEVVTK